jgi:hypothetical protein
LSSTQGWIITFWCPPSPQTEPPFNLTASVMNIFTRDIF